MKHIFMGNASTSKSLAISLILIAFFSQLPKTCRMCIIDYFCLNNCSTMISGHGSQIKFCFLQNHQTNFFSSDGSFQVRDTKIIPDFGFFKMRKILAHPIGHFLITLHFDILEIFSNYFFLVWNCFSLNNRGRFKTIWFKRMSWFGLGVWIL